MYQTTHTLPDGRELRVREATPPDAQAVLDYVDRTAGESDNLSFGPGELGVTLEEEEALFQRSLDSDIRVYLIAEVRDESGTQIVGSISFAARERPRVRHVGGFGITVRQDHWRLGIGGILMDSLIAWARTGGVITKINLEVRTSNLGAIRLYEKKGFVHEGTIKRAMRIRGEYVDHHCMGLCI